MTTAMISAFESTLHKTNVWLKDLMTELDWESADYQRAYHALRAVLQALRDRLTVEEASHLASQLPMLVRGFYYEGWSPQKTPTHECTREDFLNRVAEQFAGDRTADVEKITRAVFKVLSKHISPGEIRDVKDTLPKALCELWD